MTLIVEEEEEEIVKEPSQKKVKVRKMKPPKKPFDCPEIDKGPVFCYVPERREWWQRKRADFAFNHPIIRSRLERLMGSNLVQVTDRNYMRRLHERILEDYVQGLEKRIAQREAKEREREKKLVLTGQIPFDQAPKDMANHPVLLINAYCEKLIAERRAKIKVPQVYIPLYLYIDDTPDPPGFLSIAEGHFFRKADDRVCVPPETHLQFTDEEDVEKGYMFTPEDFEACRKYESPLIQELDAVETVEEMYNLADDIIGPLKYVKPAEA